MTNEELIEKVAEFKPCVTCGKRFDRVPKLSAKQWKTRRFCSKQCSGIRRRMSAHEMVSIYKSGHSSTEISQLSGVSATQVLRVIKRHIQVRSASENKRLSHSRHRTKARLSAAAIGRPCKEHVKERLRQNTGSKNARWKNGLCVVSGYLAFTASPANGEHAGKFLHRIIAEWGMGRRLRSDEAVHHIDKNKQNNEPKNLQVMTKSDHARLHALESGLGKRKRIA